jgi:NAD(P)-dependent dehydrogenase (short-subunit alcohol dehydrogenase family)
VEAHAGKLVVITGAGSGIGRATALAFAEKGARVVAADINGETAKRTAELASLLGPPAAAFELDVSSEAAMETFAKRVRDEQGVPDVVVNNAGIGIAGPFLDTSVADWKRILDVNLWGVIHGCRLFGRQMADRGQGGHLVNIASMAAFTPSRLLPAYSTTKAAVWMLSECLRAELAGRGIGVSAICPGLVDTGISTATKFVGLDGAEEGRRQRAAKRMYKKRRFPPELVAREVLRAVEHNLPLVPVTFEAKLGRAVSRVSPGLARLFARLELEKA